jgi:hypothetical protein
MRITLTLLEMKYFIAALSLCVFILLGFLVSCSEPISSGPPPVIQIPTVDSVVVKLDSCEERLLTLRTVNGCPEYVGGLINDHFFQL